MAVRISAAVQRLQGSVVDAEGCPSTIGPITLEVKQTGERSAGNPHAAFDVAGAGNAARSRYCDTRRRKMLWGGSGENISIAALSKPMEPRYDETQSQDCERSQPVSRPAGYGRDGDRGDRDESIELACGWHCSWCRAPAAEETGDRRARIAQAVEPLACGGRTERPPDHTHRRGVRGRTRRLLAGALARCAGHREPRHSCAS